MSSRRETWYWPVLFLALALLSGWVVFLSGAGTTSMAADFAFLVSVACFLFTSVRQALRWLSSLHETGADSRG